MDQLLLAELADADGSQQIFPGTADLLVAASPASEVASIAGRDAP